jgi:hypothetical protein
MEYPLCDWVCASCGETQKHPVRCIIVQCECGCKCLRLLPGDRSGFRSLRRSFPGLVASNTAASGFDPSTGNCAGVARLGQLSLRLVR